MPLSGCGWEPILPGPAKRTGVQSIIPFIVAAMLGNVVLVFIFGWLWRERRTEWLLWWAVSFASAALRYSLGVADAFQPDSLLIYFLYQLMTAASAVFLLAGTAAFVGRKTPRWGTISVAFGLLWSLVAHTQGVSFALTTAPLFFALAVIMIHAGLVLLKSVDVGMMGRRMAAFGLIAHGLHRFDYPFLRDEVWFQPWGFLLAATCELTMGIGFLVDVFEGTRQHAAVNELRYREFFVRSPAGFFRASPEGVILDANPAFLSLLGCASIEEVRALSSANVDLTALLREARHVDEASLSVPTTPGRADTVVQEWKAKSGEPVVVTGAGRLVRDREGKAVFYEGFVRDVTLERRLDAQLKHAQRAEVVGRLAGGIAHDFNNLLTVIAGNVSLLKGERELPGESAQLLDEIAEAADQANTLTRQMLALTKKTPFARQRIDIVDLVVRNRAVLQRLVGKSVNLVIDARTTALVHANAGHLDQVLLNLVINARDAMPDGGMVTVSTSLAEESGEVILRVSDTGVGMSPEVMEHIFEPFFTTKDVGQGTGLGLSVVESVVTQLGGTIAVDSAPAAGTTFTVRLPVVDDTRISESKDEPLAEPSAARGVEKDDPRAPGEDVRVPHPSLSKSGEARRADDGTIDPSGPVPIRVLLVDDDPAITRLMERGLSTRGLVVSTCERAPIALEILSSGERFDLIASDITMPEMDGIALARLVAERYPNIPMILMSGYAERAEEIADSPSIRVLEKPFTVETLLAVIHETLKR
jgi:two-component system cell cycle sensor histidine kinase/response regulator CckA